MTDPGLASGAQITNNVKLLLDATRSATNMTNALNSVQSDLMRYDYAQTLLGTEEVGGLRDAASRILAAHQETARKLETLSQNLGLSSVSLPDPGSMTENEQRFLQHLVHLQTQRHILWENLQSYQD